MSTPAMAKDVSYLPEKWKEGLWVWMLTITIWQFCNISVHYSRYCNEHALKATLARTKQNAKCPPPNTAEVLLASLSHYIKKPKLRAISNSRQNDEDKTGSEDTDLKNATYLDPFGMYPCYVCESLCVNPGLWMNCMWLQKYDDKMSIRF